MQKLCAERLEELSNIIIDCIETNDDRTIEFVNTLIEVAEELKFYIKSEL